MTIEAGALHPGHRKSSFTGRHFRPLAFAAATALAAVGLLTARDRGETTPTQPDRPNPTPQIGQLIENPTPAPLAVSVEPFASPTATETLAPTLTPTEILPLPTATVEAIKEAPKVVERKPLFSSVDAKQAPLGIKEKGWVQGYHLSTISGFLTRGVYEEDGDLFYNLAIPDPKDPTSEIELKVFLSNSASIDQQGVGINYAGNRMVRNSPTYYIKKIREIVSQIQEGDQIIVEVVDNYEDDHMTAILSDPRCDDLCQERLGNIIKYAPTTQAVFKALAAGQVDQVGKYPIGLTSQLTLGAD